MDYSVEIERRFDAVAAAEPLPDGGFEIAGEAEDRALNVWVRFEVQVSGGTIGNVRFRVFGCPHTIAAASWIAEALRGAPAEALRGLDMERVRRELSIPREKLGKLLRIEDAVLACIEQIGPSARERATDARR